jgi:hypothetical protein
MATKLKIEKRGDEILIVEGGAVGHNFEREPPRDHPCQIWFNLVQRFQRRRFKCDLLSKYAYFA